MDQWTSEAGVFEATTNYRLGLSDTELYLQFGQLESSKIVQVRLVGITTNGKFKGYSVEEGEFVYKVEGDEWKSVKAPEREARKLLAPFIEQFSGLRAQILVDKELFKKQRLKSLDEILERISGNV